MLSELQRNQLQKACDNRKWPIRFKVERRITSLSDVFWVCFKSTKDYTMNSETVYQYKNGNTRFQCHNRAYRSLGDLYLIARFYIPHITLIQVENALDFLVKEKLLVRNFCTVVRKQVHYSIKTDKTGLENYLNENKLNVHITT